MTTTTVTLSAPGTATIVDTTAEAIGLLQTSLEASFTALQGELTLIEGNLTTLNTNVVALTTALNATFSPLAAATPGSVANSAVISKDLLALMTEVLIQMQENMNNTSSAIGQLQFSMAGVGSAIQEGVATQQFAVADQVNKNAFEKAATKDALARAGLPEPTPPTFAESAEEMISNSVALSTTASATSYVTNKIAAGISTATSYATQQIAQSAVGEYATTQWTRFSNWLFGIKITEKTRNETIKAGLTAAKAGIPPAV